MNNRLVVYGLLTFVMLSWGLNVTALKILVVDMAPITMNAFRVFVAGVGVLLMLWLTKSIRKLTLKEYGFLAFISLFNVVGHHLFLSVGLSNTTATNGGLILGLVPILTAIVSIPILKTRLSFIKTVGIIIAFFGVSFVVLIGSTGTFSVSIGDAQVFISGFTQAISFALIKKASSTIDARLMTGWMMVIGSVIMFILSFIFEPEGLSTMATTDVKLWSVFFASALIATAFGHMTYNYAIQRIGPSESAVFINLNPLFALLGGVVFLGEAIYIEQGVGFILVVIGVLCGSGAVEHWRKQKKEVQLRPPA
ncbi:DMT family transporter [Metabacillus fastidiosus]|uniref:DMT family transporter n=1 Tax=Metabacillus fastidiosus TaxID=1458 RepID=UPI002E1A695D|nr:DMT family transporter [Metabacillus fastidiosus]